MEKPIIEVKNISKKYSIAHMRGGYVTLRDIIAGIIKNPFSFLKHKTKQVVGLEKKEEFWALKDISFNVKKGEVIGVVGANGAGKSTLLKVLSQITPPTDGEIIIRGRVGSLLEVGTGFHPELTGRENIFLNGAILGMTKTEIVKKFDQIIEFAGIEKFLDTPVKFYSSGMYVRLAFSVAAHMEPDILLVDEVLAVGDAEFQKKCLGKMDKITKEEGRTIIFVSHNLGAIKQLCNRTILLKNGSIEMVGPTVEVIEKYALQTPTPRLPLNERVDRRGDGKLRFTDIEFFIDEKITNSILTGEPFKVRLYYKNNESSTLTNVAFSFSINDPTTGEHLLVFWTETSGSGFTIDNKRGYIDCNIKTCPLTHGHYPINVYTTTNGLVSDYVTNASIISVDDTKYFNKGRRDADSHPQYIINHDWSIGKSE